MPEGQGKILIAPGAPPALCRERKRQQGRLPALKRQRVKELLVHSRPRNAETVPRDGVALPVGLPPIDSPYFRL
jgi:hypothetical protein